MTVNWHTTTPLFLRVTAGHNPDTVVTPRHTLRPRAGIRKATDMNKAAPPHRWFAGWRATERPVQDDPADLGTAFGLDMSLNELTHEPPPATSERRVGWMQRLAGRSKPAG
jgi:hypothetical protein